MAILQKKNFVQNIFNNYILHLPQTYFSTGCIFLLLEVHFVMYFDIWNHILTFLLQKIHFLDYIFYVLHVYMCFIHLKIFCLLAGKKKKYIYIYIYILGMYWNTSCIKVKYHLENSAAICINMHWKYLLCSKVQYPNHWAHKSEGGGQGYELFVINLAAHMRLITTGPLQCKGVC